VQACAGAAHMRRAASSQPDCFHVNMKESINTNNAGVVACMKPQKIVPFPEYNQFFPK